MAILPVENLVEDIISNIKIKKIMIRLFKNVMKNH